MNKKIVMGSVFVTALLIFLPVVSSLQNQQNTMNNVNAFVEPNDDADCKQLFRELVVLGGLTGVFVVIPLWVIWKFYRHYFGLGAAAEFILGIIESIIYLGDGLGLFAVAFGAKLREFIDECILTSEENGTTCPLCSLA